MKRSAGRVAFVIALTASTLITMNAVAQNPLPVPNHPMDFGYYFPEWVLNGQQVDYTGELFCYTNTYYADKSGFGDPPDRQGPFREGLRNGAAECCRPERPASRMRRHDTTSLGWFSKA